MQKLLLTAMIGLATTSAGSNAHAQDVAGDPTDDAVEQDSMSLEGGENTTLFESMTIEGEDRIRIAFERPALTVDLDPLAVGGLEWIQPATVVDRVPTDFFAPFLASTAGHRTAHAARPWLMRFPDGPVARFRPEVTGVDRWSFIIADSRGQTAATFGGDGKPPKELAWDGIARDGEPALPGLTYSHALEAFDKAGNKRSFVGEGFVLPAYVVADKDRFVVLIPGSEIGSLLTTKGSVATPPLLLEAATRINDTGRTQAPVSVRATARSFDQANALAQAVVEQMSELLVGDPLRIKPMADVKPDSPSAGAVSIIVEG